MANLDSWTIGDFIPRQNVAQPSVPQDLEDSQLAISLVWPRLSCYYWYISFPGHFDPYLGWQLVPDVQRLEFYKWFRSMSIAQRNIASHALLVSDTSMRLP